MSAQMTAAQLPQTRQGLTDMMQQYRAMNGVGNLQPAPGNMGVAPWQMAGASVPPTMNPQQPNIGTVPVTYPAGAPQPATQNPPTASVDPMVGAVPQAPAGVTATANPFADRGDKGTARYNAAIGLLPQGTDLANASIFGQLLPSEGYSPGWRQIAAANAAAGIGVPAGYVDPRANPNARPDMSRSPGTQAYEPNARAYWKGLLDQAQAAAWPGAPSTSHVRTMGNLRVNDHSGKR